MPIQVLRNMGRDVPPKAQDPDSEEYANWVADQLRPQSLVQPQLPSDDYSPDEIVTLTRVIRVWLIPKHHH